jgi:hypothetical protein
MTSVRRLADEIESLVNAREAVLCDKLAVAIADNDVLRRRLQKARADTYRLKNENENENDEIGRELAAAKTGVATLKTQLLGCELRANSQWHRNATAATARNKKLVDVKAQLATARAQLETYATTAAAHVAAAAARDRELADVKAQLATTQLRLRDKLELDILAARGERDAEAETFRRSTRDPTDPDLAELDLEAQENNEEVDEVF